MVCYDDRYTLKLASEIDGIVVSNDNYRDLIQESPEFRKVVEEKILMYSFVNDRYECIYFSFLSNYYLINFIYKIYTPVFYKKKKGRYMMALGLAILFLFNQRITLR